MAEQVRIEGPKSEASGELEFVGFIANIGKCVANSSVFERHCASPDCSSKTVEIRLRTAEFVASDYQCNAATYCWEAVEKRTHADRRIARHNCELPDLVEFIENGVNRLRYHCSRDLGFGDRSP